MENIFHRVSIRKYQDKSVEKEKIMQILADMAINDAEGFAKLAGLAKAKLA